MTLTEGDIVITDDGLSGHISWFSGDRVIIKMAPPLSTNNGYGVYNLDQVSLNVDAIENFGFFERCSVCNGRDPSYCDSHPWNGVWL